MEQRREDRLAFKGVEGKKTEAGCGIFGTRSRCQRDFWIRRGRGSRDVRELRDATQAAPNPAGFVDPSGHQVGSFDAGYGSSIMSRLVGPKKAKEMWFLSRFYNAYEAEKMGLVNAVVKLENLELETVKWCREILRNSPTAIRVLKSALNAVDDGHAGLQDLGGNATYIFYGTEEAKEGKRAFMERRCPDYSKFPRRP